MKFPACFQLLRVKIMHRKLFVPQLLHKLLAITNCPASQKAFAPGSLLLGLWSGAVSRFDEQFRPAFLLFVGTERSSHCLRGPPMPKNFLTFPPEEVFHVEEAQELDMQGPKFSS